MKFSVGLLKNAKLRVYINNCNMLFITFRHTLISTLKMNS